MFKKILFRFWSGFCWSVSITMLVHLLITELTGTMPMLPEFTARFSNEVTAYMTELALIGVMSAVTSASTIILETKKIGMVFQSILFLIVMLCVWIPVANFVWSFNKYTGSMISTISSIVVTYGICWWIQYKNCRKEIDEINEKLSLRKE